MTRVVIEVSDGVRLSSADADSMSRSLSDLGWRVELRGMIQRRDPGTAVDVALRILESVEEHALDALVGAVVGSVVASLKRPEREAEPKATVALYGPNGQELRRVEVNLREDEDRKALTPEKGIDE